MWPQNAAFFFLVLPSSYSQEPIIQIKSNLLFAFIKSKKVKGSKRLNMPCNIFVPSHDLNVVSNKQNHVVIFLYKHTYDKAK